MALISCNECGKEVSDQAAACPNCGNPVQSEIRYPGPPTCCAKCGGGLRKTADAPSEGAGCLIALIGLLLTPLLIGIPILLYGLHLAGKRNGFYECKRCGNKSPRKIGTFEFV